MNVKKVAKKIILILIFFSNVYLQAQDNSKESLISIDFRSQNISDILYALADMCSQSIYIDETVSGRMSFHFEDASFESALNRFSDYAGLYVEKKENVYFISKVNLSGNQGFYSINAEDVSIEPLLICLSKKTGTTILYERFPDTKITIRCKDVKLEEILNLILIKLNGFQLEKVGPGYYISKNASVAAKRNIDSFVLTKNKKNDSDISYSLKLQKANFINVLDDLFKKHGKEYSVINAKPYMIENLYYDDKNFDVMLQLILEAANCDYKIENDIYYVFEIQKKDVLKKFKDTEILKLQNLNVDIVTALIPSELNASAFMKADKSTNSIVLTGSKEELNPIIRFIKDVDVPLDGRFFQKFTLKNMSVKDALSTMPKTLFLSEVISIPGTSSFITQVTEEKEKEIDEYLKMIDDKPKSYSIKLKYIKSEDLMKNLPPSVSKDNIRLTDDSSLVFFVGSQELYDVFVKELSLVDKPKQQVRYQLLILQHQKSSGLNYSSGISSIKSTEEEPSVMHSTSMLNMLNVNFDIISKMGIQFAGSLSAEISEGASHILADTTLNGISGQTISFSNTNTFRYRDIIRDKSDVYTSTVREISSGLNLAINGWVSGDEMITVEINASMSKQGSVDSSSDNTTNPPSTSEKKVTTHVRTKSGEPVIVSGLLQEEKDTTVKRVPIIGSIPLVGLLFRSKVQSTSQTELVIYLVPFVESTGNSEFDYNKNIDRFYSKYLSTIE